MVLEIAALSGYVCIYVSLLYHYCIIILDVFLSTAFRLLCVYNSHQAEKFRDRLILWMISAYVQTRLVSLYLLSKRVLTILFFLNLLYTHVLSHLYIVSILTHLDGFPFSLWHLYLFWQYLGDPGSSAGPCLHFAKCHPPIETTPWNC